MEIRCPACRKMNNESLKCIRCGCDLSILNKILKASRHNFLIGLHNLKNGSGSDALFHAKRSWDLKKTTETAKLGFMASLLADEFDQAIVWYRRSIKELP